MDFLGQSSLMLETLPAENGSTLGGPDKSARRSERPSCYLALWSHPEGLV